MNSLEISFNSPQCGWMSIGFDDGVNEFHTTTAHAPHELALRELLGILTSLLDTSRIQTEHVLKWNRDPEEFDFVFRPAGEKLTIEIYQYPDRERETAERSLMFLHTGALGDICMAFAKTLEQVYEDRTTDEFEFNWRQPFPIEEFDRFEAKLTEGLIK